jgi:site-specific DNA-methyltransferase (adenine-specific)
MEANKIYQGDCLKALSLMEANTIDSIVTDPPYGLGFMGKEWDNLPPGQEVFEQCLRVLKPGGHLLCFGGTRTYHRMAVAVEDAGFEIRDQIMWVYGSGFPKSQNIGKAVDKKLGNEREDLGVSESSRTNASEHDNTVGGNPHGNSGEVRITKGNTKWEGYGTALKPAHEPIVLARKPIEKGLNIAQNCLKWGVGAINVDGCRVNVDSEDKNHRNNPSSGNNGAKSIFGVGGHNGNLQPQGRFPANFIHDGSDEVVGLFPVTSSGKAPPKEVKSTTSWFGCGTLNSQNQIGDSGSAVRFFYCPKATKKERGEYNNHPTVKPIKLMEYLVKLITPEGGTVLDPFCGSGTTGIACLNLDRNYILIDQDPESIKIAEKRIDERKMPLFK